MATKEMKLICQSCGREFTVPQWEIDEYWNMGMSIPYFCSLKCTMDGWNPSVVYRKKMLRAADEKKGRK